MRKVERVINGKRYWLSQRKDSDFWFITWTNDAKRRTDRKSTKEKSIAAAEQKLDEFLYELNAPKNVEIEEAPLAVVLDHYSAHISPDDGADKIASVYQAELAIDYWLDYWGEDKPLSEIATEKTQRGFHDHLRKKGYSEGYISRILSVGRAGINQAWKDQVIKSPVFIADVMSQRDRLEAEPKGRPISIDELAKLFQKTKTPHLWAFMIGLINSIGRPGAVLAMQPANQVSWEDSFFDLNPVGKKQTNKFNPILPITRNFEPWLKKETKSGYLVEYHGKPVKSMKTAWRKLRVAADLDNQVNPYSIRHSLGRFLRKNRAPSDQISIYLGHLPVGIKRTDQVYSPFDHDYCHEAAEIVDLFCDQLKEKVGMDLTPENAPLVLPPHMTKENKTGAKKRQCSASEKGNVVMIRHKTKRNPLVSQEVPMVGGTGIEPVTPTMSTHNPRSKS